MPHVDSMPVGHPCWIDLMTSDPDASRAFYQSFLGWTSEASGPEYGGYITFSLDGTVVAGGMDKNAMPDNADMPDVWSIYLHVEDAKATAEAIVANGGSLMFDPMEVPGLGIMGFATDPTGAAIGYWQPLAHHGFGVVAEPNAPGWFELHTRDFAGAIAFYEAVFGWTTYATGDTDEFRYSTLEKDERAAAGVMDASGFLPEGVPAHWSVYFSVPDTAAAVARATELGATLVMGPDATPFGTLATMTDPTGAVFKLSDGTATPD
ncbi:VOC family protein [Iamia sp. SCSIO 61187]|uniref:VOC family protein n=1 Tax=Iamia sp. SCSIO 61187 TaxID=2722752 RepID=UPI001C62CE98|nr:VOC family protein [Iamia sp. SCSIO 61187]QYG94517.1 VOC family protein [Iamia sp. SCSIO 61187]